MEQLMQQAKDFCDESEDLHAALEPLSEDAFNVATQFKGWTINDIVQHLHHFNIMADLSLNDPEKFQVEFAKIRELRETRSTVSVSNELLGGIQGRQLFDAWRAYYLDMTPRFTAADPKQRVKWAGPDMSARSSITARQMETWAHGQEIYDLLGLERENTDRIRNIAHLGVGTFGWTFVNRKEPVPTPVPYVELVSPSGDIWHWGEPSNDERIDGAADEFCQVVCQTRNIADTSLQVTGAVAAKWMAKAQCFAGPPREPPKVGTRYFNPGGLADAW
jgi:uncharacterized protein (TIGR03084 family)